MSETYKTIINILLDFSQKGWAQFSLFLLRTIIIVIFLFSIIFLLFKLLQSFFPNTAVEKIELAGNTINFKSEGSDYYYFLYPTSSIWEDPQIEFKKDDEITLYASGKYYTAIHHLVQYKLGNETKRLFQWLGPTGVSVDSLPRKADKFRFKACPSQDGNFGALLVKRVCENTKDSIYSFKKEGEPIKIHFDKDGRLKFAVNEPILDASEKSKKMFIITKDIDSDYVKTHDKQDQIWKNLVLQKATRNTFFDDNVGELLVVIKRNNN